MPRRNLVAIVMVGAVSLLCWQVSQGAKPKDEVSELYGVFVDAVEQVQQNYVRPVSRRELMESALRGMLSDLDQHSTYINTSQWKSFKKQIEGKFGGVGMTVEVDEDSKRLKVVAPMVGTPGLRRRRDGRRPDPRHRRQVDRRPDDRQGGRRPPGAARHAGQAQRAPRGGPRRAKSSP